MTIPRVWSAAKAGWARAVLSSATMTWYGILLLSLGVAMDAAVVSMARGVAATRIGLPQLLRVACFFGAFQALMPLVGWYLGDLLGPALQAWNHWVACGLLTAVGGKMLWEARKPEEADPDCHGAALFGTRVMLALAIATSIDAFAVGITLPLMGAPLALSVVAMGVTTALLSALGLYLGHRFGAVFEQSLDALGGLVLIGLGIKAVVVQGL